MSGPSIKPLSRREAIDILEVVPEAKEDSGRWLKFMAATENVWAGFGDGDLVVVWGLIPPTLLSESAYLWSYTFPTMKNYEFMFVRESQLVVEEMLKRYKQLVGHTDGMDRRTMRWLQWLGAEFGPREVNGIPFVIRKK